MKIRPCPTISYIEIGTKFGESRRITIRTYTLHYGFFSVLDCSKLTLVGMNKYLMYVIIINAYIYINIHNRRLIDTGISMDIETCVRIISRKLTKGSNHRKSTTLQGHDYLHVNVLASTHVFKVETVHAKR